MKTFIVVEDDVSVRYMLEECLNKLGHKVLGTVDNIASAMQLLNSSKVPDFVLLDIILPGQPGTSLMEYMKVNHKDVRVIIVTGLSELQVMRLTPDGGYDALITKPFSYNQLSETIVSVLDSATA